MRVVQMEWTSGDWAEGIAEMIVERLEQFFEDSKIADPDDIRVYSLVDFTPPGATDES